MSAHELYIFDDRRARRWAPFSLTRPIGELLFGTMSLRVRTERALGLSCAGYLSRSALQSFDEGDSPPVMGIEHASRKRSAVFLSSRVVLAGPVGQLPDHSARITVGGENAGWIVAVGDPFPSDLWIRDPASAPPKGPEIALEGMTLGHPWDLVGLNPARISLDLRTADEEEPLPGGVVFGGGGLISIAQGATVEPGVVIDTSGGPIRLEAGVRVQGPCRLSGPLFVGENSTILGGPVGATSIGRGCKIRGEVSSSVVGDFSNKAHEGFLGHALLGSWVNLGAGTTNSNLKNNYGTVKVWTPDGDIDTGLVKVGCFLGDHVKTGIGTLLNTGTVVGAGSNVFGGAMPPVAVPPFSWGSGDALTEYRLDRFLETVERAMARRDHKLTPGNRDVLERAWAATEPQRQR